MGENICNEVTHKGFISKIYKQLMQLNIKRTNNPIKKMGGRFKQICQKNTWKDAQHDELSLLFNSIVSNSFQTHGL